MPRSRAEPGASAVDVALHLFAQRENGGAGAPSDDWLESVVRGVLVEEGIAGDVSVALLLAGDAALQRLNREFRGIDRPTDVLSFSQEEGDAAFTAPPQAARHLGDIAISIERARRQAAEYGHSFEREVAYLLAHGTLHLLGHDHEDEDARAEMRAAEERTLGALGLTRGPTETSA